MARLFLVLSMLVKCNSVAGQYQSTLVVNPNGKVFYYDKKVKKTKELRSIIAQKNDETLNLLFKKYRNKKLTNSILSRIRDFGLFYGIINEEFSPSIRPIPLSIGLAGTVVSLTTKKSKNKQLNELVDYYNYLESSEYSTI